MIYHFNTKKMIKLSEVPKEKLIDAKTLIDYMQEINADTLVNDLGSGIEYGIDDIEDSMPFIKIWTNTEIMKKIIN